MYNINVMNNQTNMDTNTNVSSNGSAGLNAESGIGRLHLPSAPIRKPDKEKSTPKVIRADNVNVFYSHHSADMQSLNETFRTREG